MTKRRQKASPLNQFRTVSGASKRRRHRRARILGQGLWAGMKKQKLTPLKTLGLRFLVRLSLFSKARAIRNRTMRLARKQELRHRSSGEDSQQRPNTHSRLQPNGEDRHKRLNQYSQPRPNGDHSHKRQSNPCGSRLNGAITRKLRPERRA